MECKCSYFLFREGKLVCSVCGQPAKEKPVIEDKVAERTEVKQIWPPESKRLGRPPKRR